jgi:hypothetical protein
MVQPMMPIDVNDTAKTVSANRRRFKHIGKLKDGGTPVAIIFRTVPGEPKNCLVIGTKFLDVNYQDTFMKALESVEGQNSFELGHHLMKSRFSDGTEILPFLHKNNFLKKMPTTNIIVTFGSGNNEEILLSDLNEQIAQQRGISIDELSLLDQPKSTTKKSEDESKKKATKSKK